MAYMAPPFIKHGGAMSDKGYVLTGKGIDLHQWVVLKGAVKLEGFGMRHSSGRTANMLAKESLDLPKNTSFDVLIEKLEEKIEEIAEEVRKEGGVKVL